MSWIYFAGGPVIFSAVMTACLGWAAWTVHGTTSSETR